MQRAQIVMNLALISMTVFVLFLFGVQVMFNTGMVPLGDDPVKAAVVTRQATWFAFVLQVILIGGMVHMVRLMRGRSAQTKLDVD